jgi:prepilin peptidase CpaA
MSSLPFLLALLFPAVLIFAALRDTTTMTIPNWLNAAGALAFFPAALAAGMSLNLIGFCLGVGVATLAVGIGMFALGWIGGGDAKLFAVCGLWLGWPAVLPFVLWTAIAGGGLAVSLLWIRKLATHLPSRGPAWLERLLTPGGDVPYGVAIAIGGLVVYSQSQLWGVLHHLAPI